MTCNICKRKTKARERGVRKCWQSSDRGCFQKEGSDVNIESCNMMMLDYKQEVLYR